MQFVFVVKGHGASVPQTLTTDRLFIAASRETARRTRHAREKGKRYTGPAPGAPLQISGSRLRDLCWSESAVPSRLSLEKDDISFHCALVQSPWAEGRATDEFDAVPLRIIAAASLDRVYLSVHEDLLQDGRLVVFTYAEHLLHVGIDAESWMESRAAAAVTEVQSGGAAISNATDAAAVEGASGSCSPHEDSKTTSAPSKRTGREDTSLARNEPSMSSRRMESPHTPHPAFKKDQALAVVPSVVSEEDIKDLNELVDGGRMANLDASLMDFFCCQCYHLPLLTLTMSCCGAVLCQHCAPTPPTVEGVSAADKACPVCGEEPLDPPLSHPARDLKVKKLAKELKVLYYPQLRALHESRQNSAERSTPSTPSYLFPSTPVLGAVLRTG